MIKDYGIALGKMLLAGGWVDGELSRDEINAVEAFLDTIPGLTEEDLKRIHLYAEFPMTMEEGRYVAEEFVKIIRTEEEKDLALLHLDALVKADRIVTPEERCFYVEMLNFLQEAPTSAFHRFSKMLKGRNKWKSAEIPEGEDRETLWLDHYINNPVYFRLRVSYMGFDLPDDLSERQFEMACLHASLMVCVEIAEGPFRPDIIADHIQSFFECTPEVAAYLVDLAAAEYHQGRLNLRKQGLQLAKVCEFALVDEFFYALVDMLAKAKTPQGAKHNRLREIARILKIEDDVTEASLKTLSG